MRPVRNFDPQTIIILRQALEEATRALPERERTQERKVRLASSILTLAGGGVRDVERLKSGALRDVGSRDYAG